MNSGNRAQEKGNKRVRVLRIINRFNLGGPTYNVSYLTKYLEPEYETLLIGGEKDESEADSDFIVKNLGITPRIIHGMKRSINPFSDYKAYKEIRKIIREFKPDIVHTHASKSGALGRLAAIKEKVPVIVHTFHGHVFHSYFSGFTTSVFKRIERYLAKKSSAIVAISEIQKAELCDEHKICPREKMEVIPLGFDLDRFQQNTEQKRSRFRKEWNLHPEEIVVSIIGRLVPVKNHEMFLESALEILQQHTAGNLRFLIVGDGELRRSLEEKVERYDMLHPETDFRKNVWFTSWIREVDTVLAGSDIVALTSWNEGTPVSLIEAHAASCPVVTTRAGGVEDIVAHGKTGFVCDPGDVKTFTEHLLKLINRADLRQSMASDAKERVIRKYSYQRLCADMDALYTRLLSKKA
jgi:glycosyltransferase involved in cell wall biosynthesis